MRGYKISPNNKFCKFEGEIALCYCLSIFDGRVLVSVFLNFRLKKVRARALWPSLLILLQPCPDLRSEASSVRNFSAAVAQTPFQRQTSGGVAKCRLFSQAMIGNPPFSVHMINYFLKSWIISSRPLIFSRNVNWG